MLEQDNTEIEVEEVSFEIEIEEMEQLISPGVCMSD